MKRASMVATVCLGAVLPNTVSAQQKSLKDQIVGTWMVESIHNVLPDGKQLNANGPNPKGMLVFDPSGRFSQIIIDATVPKYASNNRQQGTPQDYERVARGDIAYFGEYTVDMIRRSRFMSSSVPIRTWITPTVSVR